jgi:hypothetical protein
MRAQAQGRERREKAEGEGGGRRGGRQDGTRRGGRGGVRSDDLGRALVEGGEELRYCALLAD